ncbi:hypothetical protein L3Q82_019952, partial [Scortum barcoo]
VPDSTSHFLHCVGLPSNDTGKDHVQRLKEILQATMDIYTFMRSSMTGVPLLSLEGALQLNPGEDPLQNEALVQMWMEVKIKPLLKSITKHFLSCLSTKNFSCSTYQTVYAPLCQLVSVVFVTATYLTIKLSFHRVREFSQQFSEMNPVRQQWIYTFFMYPFLSGDAIAGCVQREEDSEEWLMKNFGAFRAMARMEDFSELNIVFSGLEVLHLLSPAQKAKLLLSLEDAGLDNETVSLVFHSLLTGGSGPPPTAGPGWGNNWTSPEYPPQYPPPHPQNDLGEVAKGFVAAFRPVGSFVHEFVSFTKQRNVSEIRSTTLTQFLLNWTLAELADMYRPPSTSVAPEMPTFDVTNVEDWYQQVVMPILRKFSMDKEAMMNPNIKLAFHEVFYLDRAMDDNNNDDEASENLDVCSITLDKSSCGLTDAVKNVANVLHCAARADLTLSEETIMRLIMELTERLNSLIKELSTVNFGELASEFQEIFHEANSPSMTEEHLQDPDFIKLWFQVKLMPLLPDIPTGVLSCLSTKNFSCPVYQTIVAALSRYMNDTHADLKYSENIYEHFIYPFLLNHNHTSGPRCISAANQSAEWLRDNFGFFSRFASITDFYRLNPHFSGLEALPLLTPKQMAEMLLLPLPTPPGKDVVINRVFDFLLEFPEQFPQVLDSLVELAMEVTAFFERLYGAIPSLPRDLEPITWAGIDRLMNIAPEGTDICRGINSSALLSYMNTSMKISCNFTLEMYACAQLDNFTAGQLVSLLQCDLPGNSKHSKVLWKMLLTKLSYVLDPALDMLANMPMTMLGPSAMEVLDVIGEMRVSMLTDEQLMNSSVIRKWFSGRLSAFLPFASERFLYCLSSRNISCYSYQQILQVFIYHFDNLTMGQQHVVLKSFILRFLSHSGAGCVSFSNGSAEWLRKNLGPFSAFLSIQELILLNPKFNPLDVLQLLTPMQIAELLVVILPPSLEKDAIINTIIDHLVDSPDKARLPEFLSSLAMFLQEGNLSCSAYKTLFTRLDLAMTTVSSEVATSITYSKMALSRHIPPGEKHSCIIYSGECTVTMTNETDICIGVNSTVLQLHLDSGQMSGRFCDFPVQEFACASLSALKAEDLAVMLACNRSSNFSGSRPVWKLLLSKASRVLDEALDLLRNMTLDPRNPAVTVVLDVLREIRLDTFGTVSFDNPVFIQLWFNGRLRPFLPALSPGFLSCLTTKSFNCSTYQHIVQILSGLQPRMSPAVQMSIYTNFIKVFLTRNNTSDPSCRVHTNNAGEWLQRNLGGFSVFASFLDLQMLYSNFSALEVLSLLTVRQLAEVSATPGQLTSPAQVTMVMAYIPNQLLAAFFDDFSPAIMGHVNMIPSPVRSAMLQVVFDRANLSDHSVGDAVVLLWLRNRLNPLLANMSPYHVAPFFQILAGRNCSIEQQGVRDLNSTISSLSEETQREIHNHIVQILRGPIPFNCYGNNFNRSFYTFLEDSFLGFQFPNLTTFLSLMPQVRMQQLLNSMPPSDLGDFLRRPDVVDNDAELCVIFSNYARTPMFLETEALPAAVRRPTLPCVWPTALSSPSRSEANAWFNRRLNNYLAFLTRGLISPNNTRNASCQAFQQLVSILGAYNYTTADFTRPDVFITIRAYLTSATVPRCYNASDPELNSTAWFAEYIGRFMSFLTLADLQAFGSAEVIQVFTVNPLNIDLLRQSVLPLDLINYYTQLVYLQDSNFNPLLLPLLSLCVVPGPAFRQLTAGQSLIVLRNLTTSCTNLDPQVYAALSSNFGDNIDASVISALGSGCTGMSTGQIAMISPQQLLAALGVLSSVNGWSEGQARAIIQSLLSSGIMQFNSSSSLLMLGSLIVGIPAGTIGGISGSQLITASQNPSFLGYLMLTPQIIRQTFVTQIISVNSNSETFIQNVPDELATEIPRAMLGSFSSSSAVITTLNRKKWKRKQVELFFDVMAVESATSVLGSPDNLSSSVLQGFTCTRAATIETVQVGRLIRACRRSSSNKVTLVESQLTCMYNYIRNDPDATNFNLFPPDVMLYYDYTLVPQAKCRSYFQQISEADFSVFSPVLRYKRDALFNNARSCLGITTTKLTKDNILVLGNMCCTLDGSYIQNSDAFILETLKNCQDLTTAQVAVIETLLQSGTTQYGAPSTWNEQTLRGLGMLPLYLSSSFYKNFDRKTKQSFLQYFLKVLRRNGVDRQKQMRMKSEIRKSNINMSKSSTPSQCTVGNITSVTISDETFPYNYDDITQFNCCLSAKTVKDNLGAITDKVDQVDYLTIVLSKLREAYAATSIIPENQVQLLGPASRVATIEDINMWSITVIDTLSALMDPKNGEWDPVLAKAIISKYLSKAGNTLGSAELSAIGGPNLCSLDATVLRNISQQSIRYTDVLTVSNCTMEKKQVLFSIAQQAFSSRSRSAVSLTSYQLIQSFLEGADIAYIRSLASSSVNMDLATFTSLNKDVVLNLTISEVKSLLGNNLQDLKSYENQTLIRSWISRQFQSELDTLGLNLEGGRTSPASSTSSPTTITNATGSSSQTSAGSGSGSSTAVSSTTTGSRGDRTQANAGLSFLLLLALLIATQHIFV